jgi:hypothetical protein
LQVEVRKVGEGLGDRLVEGVWFERGGGLDAVVYRRIKGEKENEGLEIAEMQCFFIPDL